MSEHPTYVTEALRQLTRTQKQYIIDGCIHGDCTMTTVRALKRHAMFYFHPTSPNGRCGEMRLTPLGVTVQAILKERAIQKDPSYGRGRGNAAALSSQGAARLEELEKALTAIRDLEPEPFEFPADWEAQIEACPDCKAYANHPIQGGICDAHRRPLWRRGEHADSEERRIGWRAKSIAREALQPKPAEGQP